jgi:HK97 gp10 family phage protein
MTPEQAIAQLQNFAKNSKEATKKAEFTVINQIALTAIQLAPERTSKLVGSIDIEQDDTKSSVSVSAPHAAYVEFGTGKFAAEYVAELPDEWKEEAMRHFVNGEGRTEAHPFFYPAIQQHVPELATEIDKELEKLLQ